MKATPDRKAMVRGQLVARGIRSRRVLGAFLRVDRKAFVSRGSEGQAFGDHPVPIGCGQTVSQPYMVALMLETLGIRRGMRVLEVGAGSGYALALLHALGARPFGLEWHADLAGAICKNLRAAGLGDLPVKCGDGGMGWPEEAPFDRILVSAACPEVPPPLLAQLAPGGILVAPLDAWGTWGQILKRWTRAAGSWQVEEFGGCVFVPLVGAFGRGRDCGGGG